MPVPAAPRRAAPPRKKAVKSPPPAGKPTPTTSDTVQVDSEEQLVDKSPKDSTVQGDREEEIGEVNESADPAPEVSQKHGTLVNVLGEEANMTKEPSPFSSKEAREVPTNEHEEETVSKAEETTQVPEPPVQQASQSSTSEPESVEESPVIEKSKFVEEPEPVEEQEDEEEARRKRIAEKLAKMGGINPLAPPPPRRQSTVSYEDPGSVDEEIRKRSSVVNRKESTASAASAHITSPSAEANQKGSDVINRKESTASAVSVQSAASPLEVNQKRSSVVSRKESLDIPASASSVDQGPPPPIPRKSIDSVSSARKPSVDIGSVPSPFPTTEEQSPVKLAHEESSEYSEEKGKLRVDDEQMNEVYEDQQNDEDRLSRGGESEDHMPQKKHETPPYEDEDEGLQDPEETSFSSPPPVPVSTRPLSIRSTPRPLSDNLDEHEASESVIAPSPRTSTHLPPRPSVTETSDSEADGLEQSQTLRYLPPRTAAAVASSPSPAPSPPPERVPPPRQSSHHTTEEDDEGSAVESDAEPAIPPPPIPSNRPRPMASLSDEDEEEEASVGEDEEEQEEKDALPHPSRPMPTSSSIQARESALPTPPRRGVPPPPPPAPVEDTPLQTPALDEEDAGISSYFRKESDEYDSARNVPETSSEPLSPAQEILDEDEGDPIDPSFHSPKDRSPMASSPARLPSPPQAVAPGVTPAPTSQQKARGEDTQAEDDEQARRKTIAERMAKLGGIRFGAPPPIGTPPPRRQQTTEGPVETVDTEPSQETEEPGPQLTEEEEEAARKQRIAAKLHTMGGMRFGMFPPGVQAAPQRRISTDISNAEAEPIASSPPPLPPSRPPPTPSARPPPFRAPPPVTDPESDRESATGSDDGIRIEAEESEIEEVSHQDTAEESEERQEEDEAPPVPSRAGRVPSSDTVRKSSVASVASGGRPPVPAGIRSPSGTSRKSSSGSTYPPTSPRAPTHRPSMPQHPTQSDFVMVGAPEHEEAVSPPQRTSSFAPTRSVPSAPGSSEKQDPSESVSSQWELPSIPSSSLSFDEPSADLSLSWSEDSTLYPTEHKRISQLGGAAPPSTSEDEHKERSLPTNLQLSADELMSIWGKVGVHVCTAATSLFEQSKKTLVGDGTYNGFIRAALKEVPIALIVDTPPNTFGYLTYLQNGTSVQKRASEILPGDVVVVTDAKFKGHKGLQSYSQQVGAGSAGPTLGVVSEFEPKKSKVKVFQANQHVGQQTVESVSYRLDDLKSGIIQVYRVLEA
jgi:hypothetical protein